MVKLIPFALLKCLYYQPLLLAAVLVSIVIGSRRVSAD